MMKYTIIAAKDFGCAFRFTSEPGSLECAPMFIDGSLDEYGEVTALENEAVPMLVSAGYRFSGSELAGR